jgi:hypothetical protein
MLQEAGFLDSMTIELEKYVMSRRLGDRWRSAHENENGE